MKRDNKNMQRLSLAIYYGVSWPMVTHSSSVFARYDSNPRSTDFSIVEAHTVPFLEDDYTKALFDN